MAPPVAKSILPVAGSIIKLPEFVEISFPFSCRLSTFRLLIFEFESAINILPASRLPPSISYGNKSIYACPPITS